MLSLPLLCTYVPHGQIFLVAGEKKKRKKKSVYIHMLFGIAMTRRMHVTYVRKHILLNIT